MMNLPYVTEDCSPLGGVLRREVDDFCVDEIPSYAPVGDGDHLFLHIEKRGLTTREAVSRLARALGAEPRAAGWAGLKDRHAVTTQWISLEGVLPGPARDLTLDGVRVLSAERHPHKLRVGHLRGNRFRLALRDVDIARLPEAREIFERLELHGCPNYFGPQRFGREGQTYRDARAWLIDGGHAPRGRFQRKMFVSALQSAIFNRVLAARVEKALLDRAIAGDVMRKEESGGIFVCTDMTVDNERVRAWEISPTGPMVGKKMRLPSGEIADAEAAAVDHEGVSDTVVRGFGRLGLGTRRALRVRPQEWSLEVVGEALVCTFTLPPGGYATVVMREIQKPPAGQNGPERSSVGQHEPA